MIFYKEHYINRLFENDNSGDDPFATELEDNAPNIIKNCEQLLEPDKLATAQKEWEIENKRLMSELNIANQTANMYKGIAKDSQELAALGAKMAEQGQTTTITVNGGINSQNPSQQPEQPSTPEQSSDDSTGSSTPGQTDTEDKGAEKIIDPNSQSNHEK